MSESTCERQWWVGCLAGRPESYSEQIGSKLKGLWERIIYVVALCLLLTVFDTLTSKVELLLGFDEGFLQPLVINGFYILLIIWVGSIVLRFLKARPWKDQRLLMTTSPEGFKLGFSQKLIPWTDVAEYQIRETDKPNKAVHLFLLLKPGKKAEVVDGEPFIRLSGSEISLHASSLAGGVKPAEFYAEIKACFKAVGLNPTPTLAAVRAKFFYGALWGAFLMGCLFQAGLAWQFDGTVFFMVTVAMPLPPMIYWVIVAIITKVMEVKRWAEFDAWLNNQSSLRQAASGFFISCFVFAPTLLWAWHGYY